MGYVSKEVCAEQHGNLNTKLSEMHTDIKWIKSSLQTGNTWMIEHEKADKQWEKEHENEHKGIIIKLIGAVTIITAAIAAFFGGMVK